MSVAAPARPAHREFHFTQGENPGRLRDETVEVADRNWAVALHVSLPVGAMVFGPLILAPLVIWLMRKNDSVFIDDHGRELINFGLSFILWHIVLALTIIGVLLIPVLWIVGLINIIRAAAAASAGEYFRFPITLRFLC